jgi:hypothetical protein
MFEELFRLAKRVALTHNGKNYPRILQIEAMKALQDYVTDLEMVNSKRQMVEQILTSQEPSA